MRKIQVSLIITILLTFTATAFPQNSTRLKVKDLYFAGNEAFHQSRLEGLMLTRSSKFMASTSYHEEVFQDDLETILSFYKQNGFLQVRLIDTLITIDSQKNSVDIHIHLEENKRTFVEGISVFGNNVFSDSLLLSYIKIKKGEPLRRPLIEDAVIAILSLYSENGYLDASVTPKVQINDSLHLALVDFTLIEENRSIIDTIMIVGAEKTKPSVIKRELNFKKGDTVKYSALIHSQRQLYLTSLFESVFIRPGNHTANDIYGREILIELKEKPSSELSFSVGYGTVEKGRVRAEFNTNNLSGTARKTGVGTEVNFIKQGITFSFSEPRLFTTRWKSDVAVFGQLKQEPSYHAEIIGGHLTTGRKLGLTSAISLSLRFENTNFSRVDISQSTIEKNPRIRSLSAMFSHDSRDNLFDPSSGWFINIDNKLAGSFLSGSDTFTKSTLLVKRFSKLSRHAVLGSAVEIGLSKTFGGNIEIPLNERFFTGGPTSLRGFGYQKVGPVDSKGNPLGGELKLVCNLLELRSSIYRMIGGVIFAEFGSIWKTPNDAKFSDLRFDFGCGLRVNSPIGILRLDLGINPDRRVNETTSKLYFSMGQAF